MKGSSFIILSLVVTIACAPNYKLKDHFKPELDFKIIDVQKPNSDGQTKPIKVGTTRHTQLVSWLNKNNHGWEKTDHNTHAALIIVTQEENFRILFYRDNDFIITAYYDEQDQMQQYIKHMDSNELRFLLED